MRPLNLLAVLLVLAACSVGPSPAPATTSPPPTATAPGATPTINAPVPTIDPDTDSVVDAVLADAAARMERETTDFDVVHAERGTFADSSLGCPFPNEMYHQALTDGYWIVLRAGGIEVDYRVSTRGDMTICTIPERSRQGPIS